MSQFSSFTREEVPMRSRVALIIVVSSVVVLTALAPVLADSSAPSIKELSAWKSSVLVESRPHPTDQQMIMYLNHQRWIFVAGLVAKEQAAVQTYLAAVSQMNARAALASQTRVGSTSPTNTSTPLPASSGGNAAIWACIRRGESGGNYATDTGNGYTGAYQFLPGTWNTAVSGAGYPQYANGRADLAPPGVQDAAAVWLQANDGWSQWSTAAGCGA